MSNTAYWISPKGDILEPTGYHIGAVITNPKKFGETTQTIKDTFEKYGEPVSKTSEGQSRNEIMERVMKRGFIRIRKHNIKRSQKWVIELYDMSNRKANYLANWAKHMIDNKLVDDTYADITITDLRNLKGVKKDLTWLSGALMESDIKTVNGMTVYNTSIDQLAKVEVVVEMTYNVGDSNSNKWDDYITEKINMFLR